MYAESEKNGGDSKENLFLFLVRLVSFWEHKLYIYIYIYIYIYAERLSLGVMLFYLQLFIQWVPWEAHASKGKAGEN